MFPDWALKFRQFYFHTLLTSLIINIFSLLSCCLCRASSAAACRKTWCTPATETETASSTRSPGTAVSTVGSRGASLWGCPRSVSVWSTLIQQEASWDSNILLDMLNVCGDCSSILLDSKIRHSLTTEGFFVSYTIWINAEESMTPSRTG